MMNIALLSNLLGSLLFLILTVLLLINWRGQLVGGLLILSSMLSTLWFSSIAYNAAAGDLPLVWIKVFETLRDASWLSFLYIILKQRPDTTLSTRFRHLVPVAIGGLTLLILTTTVFVSQIDTVFITGDKKISLGYLGYLFMALLGLLLVEQIYRNTLLSARWTVKFLCLGIGGIFVYDFFLYSEALLFNRINPDIWFVRGAINAMCVPLIAVAVARNPQWKMDIFVSRHVVYQSTATMVAGVYLILMAVGGYYIRNYGGTWGGALQIIFLFGALILLFVLVFSERVRIKLKVFLAEHFYKNKYDYRQEWLSITGILAENKDDKGIYTNIIRAIADTMKCPGGALWLAEDGNTFRKRESLSFYDKIDDDITLSPELVDLIVTDQPVIDIDKVKTDPLTYEKVPLLGQLLSANDVWIFMALVNNDAIMGFVLLTHPHTEVSINAEDFDLLKTVGYQIASYIALLKVTENLAQARQFEVFNRLSAFVVHDIKNLVAQLSLVNVNAMKFRNDPEFINDVFETIENSVTKMNRLLTNLQKGRILGSQANQEIKIIKLLDEVIRLRQNDKPVPVSMSIDSNLTIFCDKDRFLSVLEHLVQNAQEATPETGTVEISAEQDATETKIQVKDTGTGMDSEFIHDRLFKPFYTTKGNAGMGIGVYESREILHAMGGNIRVDSEPGRGTIITISLPASDNVVTDININ
jgi:putative PEP-CTERM system histidine kinase